jgi:hypothetical protein
MIQKEAARMSFKFSLGTRARDRISGYEGTIIARTEWLNGCKRYTLQAHGLKDGKPADSWACDEQDIDLIETAAAAEAAPTGGGRPDPVRPADPKR